MPCAHAAILAAKLGVDDGGDDDERATAAREDEMRVITVADGRRVKLQEAEASKPRLQTGKLESFSPLLMKDTRNRGSPSIPIALLLNKQAGIVIEYVLVHVYKLSGHDCHFGSLFWFPMWGLLPLPAGSSDDTWMNKTGSVVWG